LWDLGLPEAMVRAIETIRNATQQDRGSPDCNRAVKVLARYAEAESTLIQQSEDLKKRLPPGRVPPEQIKEAFKLATLLHEQNPDLKLSRIRVLVADELGIDRRHLGNDRYNISWLALPE